MDKFRKEEYRAEAYYIAWVSLVPDEQLTFEIWKALRRYHHADMRPRHVEFDNSFVECYDLDFYTLYDYIVRSKFEATIFPLYMLGMKNVANLMAETGINQLNVQKALASIKSRIRILLNKVSHEDQRNQTFQSVELEDVSVGQAELGKEVFARQDF